MSGKYITTDDRPRLTFLLYQRFSKSYTVGPPLDKIKTNNKNIDSGTFKKASILSLLLLVFVLLQLEG